MPASIARWVLYGGFVYGVSVKSVRLFSWYKNWYLGGLGILLEWYGIQVVWYLYSFRDFLCSREVARVAGPFSCCPSTLATIPAAQDI